MSDFSDTIAAVSTPPGFGGISIVRLSGDRAYDIACRLTGKDLFAKPSHSIVYSLISYNGDVLDEALVSIMKQPKTYTREDVVEINCHGGFVCAKSVLEAAICCGARLAEPGEFTKRAFLNGRIDLAQAEAVSDIINAATEQMAMASLSQLSGKMGQAVSGVARQGLEILSHLEASIEYPEYEETSLSANELAERLSSLSLSLDDLISDFERSQVMRSSFKAVIAGKPNVGKSMLLNALASEDKAIVTDIAGTTRDVLDCYANIGGLAVRFFDTAGLRESEDPIEKIGVGKAVMAIAEADLLLFVVDGSKPLEQDDIDVWGEYGGSSAIALLNKADLGISSEAKSFFDGKNAEVIEISALTGENINSLCEAIALRAECSEAAAVGFAANERHISALREAKASLESAINCIDIGLEADLACIGLSGFLSEIGKIAGETASEDVIDAIFEKFCLGK
ncbi:MAG: tRNA uridine-5-carboxymethylaminomethyl(34) synthesis GTPase MnmE [Eubacteriaceae bacterium]|nr:tRNA uridine-5-carboxymethylaminomethyl(34) synthesis GTPase MnmE [Eubacteriaceae bacterium]